MHKLQKNASYACITQHKSNEKNTRNMFSNIFFENM